MPKVNFYLNATYKNGEALILLVLVVNGQRLRYSTGETIPPQYWNKKTQRAKETKTFPHNEFNHNLEKWKYEALNIYLRLKNEGGKVPSIDDIRTELDKFNDRNQVKAVPFFDFITQRIEQLSSEGGSVHTIQKVGTLLFHLKGYCENKGIKKIGFKDITHDFFNDFKKYSYEVKRHNPNTFHRNIAELKTIMKEGKRSKHHINTDYEFFTVKKVPTYKIFLTEDELKRIYELDLSKKQGHDKVRDFFLIGCFTAGLRFSDWVKVQPDLVKIIKDKPFLSIRDEKTGTPITFPLTQTYVKNILKKYGDTMPKPLSNVKTNAYLKDIGEWAKIDDKIIHTTHVGEQKTETIVPKYTQITAHTARRSFATIMYLQGVPLRKIQLATGHSTIKMLELYIRVDSLNNALQLANEGFYNDTETE